MLLRGVAGAQTRHMRELVYLSQRKLEQFQLDRRGGALVKRIREVGVKAPLGMGEVQVGLADEVANRYAQLVRVLKELDRSERAPRWYEEDGLNPGDWVQFEAPLNFFFLPSRRSRQLQPVLMFLQPPPTQTQHGAVRLVLHGASVHLLGGRDREPQSAWLSPSFAWEFFREMEEFLADKVAIAQSSNEPELFMARAISELDYEFGVATASWMAGYAKVTMQTSTWERPYRDDDSEPSQLVVASPLYVEYVSEPSRDS
jgi:hypothetical protein